MNKGSRQISNWKKALSALKKALEMLKDLEKKTDMFDKVEKWGIDSIKVFCLPGKRNKWFYTTESEIEKNWYTTVDICSKRFETMVSEFKRNSDTYLETYKNILEEFGKIKTKSNECVVEYYEFLLWRRLKAKINSE